MCSSIFVKKGLICIAITFSLLLVGCHSSIHQSEPTADTTIQTDAEISHYQSIIDAPSTEILRAYIAQEPLLKDQMNHQKNIDDYLQMLNSMPAKQIQKLAVKADENVLQG
ncbi:MAG TPA: hypothetical protein ACHBX0_11420 [Arsenophonus sp.]